MILEFAYFCNRVRYFLPSSSSCPVTISKVYAWFKIDLSVRLLCTTLLMAYINFILIRARLTRIGTRQVAKVNLVWYFANYELLQCNSLATTLKAEIVFFYLTKTNKAGSIRTYAFVHDARKRGL